MKKAPELHADLSFCYRVYRPSGDDGDTLVLLHGSGVDETILVPLAREIAPTATLFAIRGRIVQDGGLRWFTRITPTEFDQASIRAEADAFAQFLRELSAGHAFETARAVFLGYSNGANLASSVMLLHPGLIRRAALLRAMPVLDHVPPSDLSSASVLVLTGAADVTYGPHAPALVSLLRRHGAAVASETVPSGHEFGEHDAEAVRAWMSPAAQSA